MFQRKHNASYEKRVRACVNTTESPGTSQLNIEDFVTVSHPKKYGAHDSRQKQLDDALVLYVACDLVPFSVVESPYFNGLLKSADPRYQMPTRKHLVNKLLQDKVSQVKEDVKRNLGKAKNICLTLDIWSSRQMRSYLGITAHYIINWSFENVVLACKR